MKLAPTTPTNAPRESRDVRSTHSGKAEEGFTDIFELFAGSDAPTKSVKKPTDDQGEHRVAEREVEARGDERARERRGVEEARSAKTEEDRADAGDREHRDAENDVVPAAEVPRAEESAPTKAPEAIGGDSPVVGEADRGARVEENRSNHAAVQGAAAATRAAGPPAAPAEKFADQWVDAATSAGNTSENSAEDFGEPSEEGGELPGSTTAPRPGQSAEGAVPKSGTDVAPALSLEAAATPKAAAGKVAEARGDVATGTVAAANTRTSRLADVARPAATTRLPSIEKLTEQVRLETRPGVSRIRFFVDPPELGRVAIDLSMRGDVLRGEIAADSAEVARILKAGLEQLRETMRAAGVEVDEFNVYTRERADDSARERSPESRDTSPDRRRASRLFAEVDRRTACLLLAPLEAAQRDSGLDLFI